MAALAATPFPCQAKAGPAGRTRDPRREGLPRRIPGRRRFTVDNAPPRITALTVDASRFGAQAGYDGVRIGFDASKALASPGGIEVLVGARAATCAAQSAGPRRAERRWTDPRCLHDGVAPPAPDHAA